MGCLFQLFKMVYVGLATLILAINVEYIYSYVKLLNTERFFSDNQFAHFMGIFLGFLFRVSGLLSAMKEKISLTATYALFLVLIVLLHSAVDTVFYIYVCTTLYAFLYVIVLKYRRSKQHRKNLRDGVQNTRTVLLNQSGGRRGRAGRNGRQPNLITVDLSNSASTIMPSAPPYEVGPPPADPLAHHQSQHILTVALSPTSHNPSAPGAPPPPPLSTGINMGVPTDPAYLHQLQHTPPPSYSEIYQTK